MSPRGSRTPSTRTIRLSMASIPRPAVSLSAWAGSPEPRLVDVAAQERGGADRARPVAVHLVHRHRVEVAGAHRAHPGKAPPEGLPRAIRRLGARGDDRFGVGGKHGF